MDGINYTLEWDDGTWWRVARFRDVGFIAAVSDEQPNSLERCKQAVERLMLDEKLSGLETIS
jgi:hypothetical protein